MTSSTYNLNAFDLARNAQTSYSIPCRHSAVLCFSKGLAMQASLSDESDRDVLKQYSFDDRNVSAEYDAANGVSNGSSHSVNPEGRTYFRWASCSEGALMGLRDHLNENINQKVKRDFQNEVFCLASLPFLDRWLPLHSMQVLDKATVLHAWSVTNPSSDS